MWIPPEEEARYALKARSGLQILIDSDHNSLNMWFTRNKFYKDQKGIMKRLDKTMLSKKTLFYFDCIGKRPILVLGEATLMDHQPI